MDLIKRRLLLRAFPSKGQQRLKKLQEILRHDCVTILCESPHRLISLADIARLDPTRVLFLVKDIETLSDAV